MGIQPLTRFRLSNMNCRSTARSRTTGNFENGSSRIGCSSLSTSAEHAIRALPVTRDVPQANNYVHCGTPWQRKFLPMRSVLGTDLPLYANNYLFFVRHKTLGKS